jgi:hypothetical protein
MTKTSWLGLGIVLVAVAVPLGATGLHDSRTTAPNAAPDVEPVASPDPATLSTSREHERPEASYDPPPVTPPSFRPPSEFTIGPSIVPSPPMYQPSVVPSIVPPPIRPPVGLGGPSIGAGGRGALVIPR